MSPIEKIISKGIKIIEFFSLQKAADITFELFQKTQPRKMLQEELDFYKTTKFITIENEIEPINIYTKGNSNNEVIFMLHGWNSNLARLNAFVEILVKHNYYCVLFDMPGHGKSILKKTNLKKNSLIFEAVIEKVNPTQPFSVLTHSFGSMVASYTLARKGYQLNHLIFLTTLNQFEPFFNELKRRLNLSDPLLKRIIEMGDVLLEEPVNKLVVKDKIKSLTYKSLTLFHDKKDKILPHSYSEILMNHVPNATLYSYEGIGHSRMLHNKELLEDFENMIKEKRQVLKELNA